MHGERTLRGGERLIIARVVMRREVALNDCAQENRRRFCVCTAVSVYTMSSAGRAGGGREGLGGALQEENSDKARGLEWEWHYF